MDGLDSNEDILVEVLCRLPKRSLARFKCVSRRWCSLISDRTRVFPKTSHFGLLCQACHYQPIHHDSSSPPRINFLHLDSQGTPRLARFHLLTTTDMLKSNSLLVGSCNGFLLFLREWRGKGSWRGAEFVVCHPATKRSWHLTPPKSPRGCHWILASNSNGHHFKLLMFFPRVIPPGPPKLVYSSGREEWSVEKGQAGYFLPFNPLIIDFGKSVFLNGAFYCISWGFLLISLFGKEYVKVISFPPFPYYHGVWKREGECIWESEGCVNYCQVGDDGRIGIWALHKGDWNDEERTLECEWKEKHMGVLSAPPQIAAGHHPFSFSPLAFNDDFEIVYLMHGTSIFSYSLATKEMKEACPTPFEEFRDGALCIALPFQHFT